MAYPKPVENGIGSLYCLAIGVSMIDKLSMTERRSRCVYNSKRLVIIMGVST